MRKSLIIVSFLVSGFFLGIGCQTQATLTPSPTATPLPTITHTPIPTALPALTATPIPLPTVTFPAPLPFQGTLPAGIEMRFGLGGFGAPVLSPDGNYLALASGIGIVLYHPETLTEIGILPQEDYARRIAWSPDGKKLAAVSSLETVTIWDVENTRLVQTLTALDVSCLAWSPDGKRLAMVKGDQAVEIWDLELSKLVQSFTGHAAALNQWGEIIEVLWINVNEIVSLDNEAQLIRWEADTGKVIYIWKKKKNDSSYRIDLSPDKKTLAITSIQSEKLMLWDLVAQKEEKTIMHGLPFVTEMEWSPDGKSIALIAQFASKLVFVDVNDGTIQKEFLTNLYGVHSLSWLKSGKEVITKSYYGDGDVITVWNIETGQGIRGVRSPGTGLIAWSPDGRTIAASSGKAVILWDIHSGDPRVLPGEIRNGLRDGGPNYEGTFRMAFNPSGSLLAAETGDDSSRIWVWNVTTGKLVEQNWIDWHLDELSWLSDTRLFGRMLAGDALVWDIGNWESRQKIDLDSLDADHLDISPDGELVALVVANTIEIRKLESKEVLQTWQVDAVHTFHLDWSPDGTKIVLIDTEKFTVYEAGTGKRLNTLMYDADQSGYSGCKWSPDSTAIAYLLWTPDKPQPSPDEMSGTARIYFWRINAANAKLISTQKNADLYPNNLSFSPDSKYLALALWQKGLIVLRLP